MTADSTGWVVDRSPRCVYVHRGRRELLSCSFPSLNETTQEERATCSCEGTQPPVCVKREPLSSVRTPDKNKVRVPGHDVASPPALAEACREA